MRALACMGWGGECRVCLLLRIIPVMSVPVSFLYIYIYVHPAPACCRIYIYIFGWVWGKVCAKHLRNSCTSEGVSNVFDNKKQILVMRSRGCVVRDGEEAPKGRKRC